MKKPRRKFSRKLSVKTIFNWPKENAPLLLPLLLWIALTLGLVFYETTHPTTGTIQTSADPFHAQQGKFY